jgi:hypothetical protein
MRIENIIFDIQDDRISCENAIGPLNSKKWTIDLLPDKIVYSTKRKTTEFVLSNIQELQYEADILGRYDLQDAGKAYIVLKDNPFPQYFFSVVVDQSEFALMDKTNASIICDQVLSFIGNKYNIPCNYKVPSEKASRKNSMGLVVAVMVILPMLMWLIYRFNLS